MGAIHDPFYNTYLMFRIHIAGGVVLRTSAVCAGTAGMPRWILYIGFHTSLEGKSSSFVSFFSSHHGLFVSILQLNFPTIILVLNLHLNHNYYLFLILLFIFWSWSWSSYHNLLFIIFSFWSFHLNLFIFFF